MSENESIPFDSLGNEQIRFVLVKTAWMNPGQEAKLHFQIIAAERAIDLAELQQAIQDDFEEHAEEDLTLLQFCRVSEGGKTSIFVKVSARRLLAAFRVYHADSDASSRYRFP